MPGTSPAKKVPPKYSLRDFVKWYIKISRNSMSWPAIIGIGVAYFSRSFIDPMKVFGVDTPLARDGLTVIIALAVSYISSVFISFFQPMNEDIPVRIKISGKK